MSPWVYIVAGVVFVGFAVYIFMFPGTKGTPDAHTKLRKVQSKHSPAQTRFEAKKEEKAATARAEELVALNQESTELVRTVDKQKELEAAQFLKEHYTERLTLEHERANAADRMMTAQDELTIRLIRQAGESNLDVSSYVDINAHRERKAIDLDARWKEILQDSNAADLALIGDHLVIKKLRQELREARKERYAIKTGDDPEELKLELLADYDKFIERLEAKIDERETGHLLPENGEAQRRLTEGQDQSRADYPAEVDEDSI